MKTKKSKIKQKNKGNINGKMTFAEVVSKYPKTSEIFMKHGMHCIGCPMAMSESIKDGAESHGMDVKKLIEELNKAVK